MRQFSSHMATPRIFEPTPAPLPPLPPAAPHVPSDSQRKAIEAKAVPLLVLAGPGAGKTFCLIERIRYLIEHLGFRPDRLCAFTFTNKAAGEIAERLERTLGERAAYVKTGTIHAFCAELLREFGARIGLEPGFGIADDRYQRAVLRRLAIAPQWHTSLLTRFSAHRFRRDAFRHPKDGEHFERYQNFLAQRNVLDFDMLVIKTAELLGNRHVVARIRARWDCVLVDEFQDLNPVQYAVIRDLGRDHGHVFAVGDEEQSIYSWAGADPKVFLDFLNDFTLTTQVSLRENRRCPREIVALARKLVEINEPIFPESKQPQVGRQAPDCVSTLTFPTEDHEIAWIVRNLRNDKIDHGLEWGDFALLYRTHQIGDLAEAGFLAAGIPCRLAHGRALAEDPVISYVIAALGVIACADDIHQEEYLATVLPKGLVDSARARAAERGRSLLEHLDHLRARELPKDHGDAKKISRGFYALANLAAIGQRHVTITGLVEELLSQRVGEYRTVLEEHHDELTDPWAHDEVMHLAARLRQSIETHQPIWIPRLGGSEIALKGMLTTFGIADVRLGGTPPDGAEWVVPDDAPMLGLPMAVFKAAQAVRSRSFTNAFRDFTAIDVETTNRDAASAELVEIAAVRVRNGVLVAEYHSLVKPRVPIAHGAARTHGITAEMVADSPYFEEVWPAFHDFCGRDMLVAHNGYQFDFPILQRMAGVPLCTYDTLPLARDLHPGSAKLPDLARHFGIDAGTSHRALDDTRTLARVFLALGEAKVVRARKTALPNLLDYLGLGLALSDDGELDVEAQLLRRLARPYALGRYSDCLEHYRVERELAEDNTLPTVADVIELLGGEKNMERVRATKSADDRYPLAMARLRRLLDRCGSAEQPMSEQVRQFLEYVALSKSDGAEPERERVNLLTLHSTKGLEFSRVYIVGVEDAQLPGGSAARPPSKAELEEARRLLYVGMTRAKDRLVLTHVAERGGKPTGGHRFLDEMGLTPVTPVTGDSLATPRTL